MIEGLLIGLLVGLALGGIAGAGAVQAARLNRTPPAGQAPIVQLLEDHPPGCVCKGTGRSDLGDPCLVVWRRPQDQVRLVGRLPRGSQR